ncbi:MAG: molybdenum cofactor biosynthesis protein MoaE [Gammaproteobacteria bacterium]
MTVEVRATPFDPWLEISRYQDTLLALHGKYGATASFVGTLRDRNQGDAVREMTLEHYPDMTEKFMQRICDEATQRWEILDTLVIHRCGHLQINDPIVLIAVWSAHRAAAFAACQYLIDELKQRAPFWKREELAAGGRWVEQNTR